MAAGVGSLDQYAASMATLEETYNRAVSEINGTAAAQRDANAAFEEYDAESALLRMDDRARAIELERRRYQELITTLETGSDSTTRIAAATEQYNQRLVQINAQFDELATGGSTGGGGAAATLEEIDAVMKAKKETIESLLAPLQQYTIMMQALNELMAEGALTQDQFAQSARQARITFLDSQTSMQAGFERGFLKILESTGDIATQMEGIVTKAFDGMSSAIADLVVDGEADFGSLIRSINKMIVQFVISQAFQELFGGAKVDGNGLFSSFSGFLGGLVDGLFGVGGGGAPGAARGGSFTVGQGDGFGGLNGHDNRMVPLRLKSGEHVEITPRGQEPGGRNGGGPTVIFNVTTPDAESFKSSQTQLAARAARMITTGQRNM
jgi:lambda family phage tail tape measure protein